MNKLALNEVFLGAARRFLGSGLCLNLSGGCGMDEMRVT